MNHPSANAWLSGDLHNLLRGLEAGAAGLPDGKYADGYHAALVAVGVAVGMERDDRRGSGTIRTPVVFDGIEDVPWAIGAFAGLGR